MTNAATPSGNSLDFHSSKPSGKISVVPSKPVNDPESLALAYTPGVAEPCKRIAADQSASFEYTSRGNLVAVVTNGSAVLGLGNLGAHAAKPVMEGKAVLFKTLAGIDAFDIEVDAQSVEAFVGVVQALEPTFGGINLEDIKAPDCFEIEDRLKSLVQIPVFHDDQHGTAIVIAAALQNACLRTRREITSCRVVINGAGAAGLATAHLLNEIGVPEQHITLCDIVGVLHKNRLPDLHSKAHIFAHDTSWRTLDDCIEGTDVFIGLSAKDAMSKVHVSKMAKSPIIFALANPDPEITPQDVNSIRSDAIIATGQSGAKEQINNLLAFPFVFRGALDVRATRITDNMKIAAVNALAELGRKAGKLLPTPFDPDLMKTVPKAVSQAAIKDGVALEPRSTGLPENSLSPVPDFLANPAPKNIEFGETQTPVQTRKEHDFLGEMSVPKDRYFGSETMRAVQNFPITGIAISNMPELIRSLAWIKKAAAITNENAKALDPAVSDAITRTCDEILDGRLHEEFCVDVIQGGAGTSTNMNANEVIANRTLELLGRERGDYTHIHPKDHVNKCQSTNDVYATAIRLTVVQINRRLMQVVERCVGAFGQKAQEFSGVPKLGRTQLQDAVPMTVGQEMSAFATALAEDISRMRDIERLFLEVNLGGTAIGTGVGVSKYYSDNIVAALASVSGLIVTEAENRIEASWDTGAFVLYSGLLKRLATKFSKIANDLRLLSSGPVGGLGELILPAQQPGSSIMPGKVNPVIPEVLNQACFKVFGADTTVTFASEAGQLQLNAMEPIIIWSIYDACQTLIASIDTFIDNCVLGIQVNTERCSRNLETSTALVTCLSAHIGYSEATKITQRILDTRCGILEAIEHLMPERFSELKFLLEAEMASLG